MRLRKDRNIAMVIVLLFLIMAVHLISHYTKITYEVVSQYRTVSDSKVRAAIVILCRNTDRKEMAQTLISFENRFNRQFRYPYVFLNDEPFEDVFKEQILSIVSGGSNAMVKFGLVPKEHWSYPSWIDQKLAEKNRNDMKSRRIMYGGSESYRFMCRYFSGFFYKHPLLLEYEYYWRVEPGVQFLCNIDYDVFQWMKDHKKLYGFVIIINEIMETIPSLWKTVLESQKKYLQKSFVDQSFIGYFGDPKPDGYNGCHFWSNFEIASFSFYRSPEYQKYFEDLDRAGGFFYERWGDAPVHSIAAGLFLKPNEVHYFEDLGYKHPPFFHCPSNYNLRQEKQCACNPFNRWEASRSSCFARWRQMGLQ